MAHYINSLDINVYSITRSTLNVLYTYLHDDNSNNN